MNLRFVFDQFPCPEGARFVEVEDSDGKSVNAGEWRERPDGLVELCVKFSDHSNSEAEAFIENWFEPWGSWKTIWWEGEVGDHVPMTPNNALRHVQKLLK